MDAEPGLNGAFFLYQVSFSDGIGQVSLDSNPPPGFFNIGPTTVIMRSYYFRGKSFINLSHSPEKKNDFHMFNCGFFSVPDDFRKENTESLT